MSASEAAPRTVVCAVIERDGRVLVARRGGDRSFPGRYEFPGGKVERGETAAAAVVREVREELACDVEVVRHLDAVDHDYGGGRRFRLLFLSCRLVRGEPAVQPGSGLAAVEWAERARLPAYAFLDGDRAFVERLARRA